MFQLQHIIQGCVTAMESGVPIIFLETEDMEILDRLFRSEELLEYWHKDSDTGWDILTDNDREDKLRPQNVSILSGRISHYFDSVNENIKCVDCGTAYKNECFVAEHTQFRYYKPELKTPERRLQRIIACRNFVLDSQSKAFLQRLVSEHISSLDDDGIRDCFYFLQSPNIQIPEGLEKYVQVITIPPISDEEIEHIIEEFVSNTNDSMPSRKRTNQEKSSVMDSYIVRLRGFSNPQIISCLRRIKSLCGSIAVNNYGTESIDEISQKVISSEKEQMLQKSGVLRIKQPGDREAAGLECVKDWVIRRRSLLDNAIEAKRVWGLDCPKGILVYGLPGTGKSLMADTLSNTLKWPLVQMDMGGLQSKYHGESEQNMRRMLRMAESIAPCVLWIDEIEKAFSGITGSGEADGGTARRNFATFLTWMQEKKASCFIFATANDVNLPPELLRRGRFDQKFFTFMPTKSECVDIFRASIIGKYGCYRHLFDPTIITEGYLNDIVEYCGKQQKFVTGADIAGIVEDAKSIVYAENYSKGGGNEVKYTSDSFKKALYMAIMESHPYGETNMNDIIIALFGISKHRFAPSSKEYILNVNDVDCAAKTIGPFIGKNNGYDDKLYNCIKKSIEQNK